MANWHGTQRLLLKAPWLDTPEQIANFHASVEVSGNLSTGGANLRTHGRIRNDGKEMLYESSWTEEELTREYWVTRLAEATGKTEAAIDAQLEHEVMGDGLSIEEGNEIVRQFLADNRAKWEGDVQ